MDTKNRRTRKRVRRLLEKMVCDVYAVTAGCVDERISQDAVIKTVARCINVSLAMFSDEPGILECDVVSIVEKHGGHLAMLKKAVMLLEDDIRFPPDVLVAIKEQIRLCESKPN